MPAASRGGGALRGSGEGVRLALENAVVSPRDLLPMGVPARGALRRGEPPPATTSLLPGTVRCWRRGERSPADREVTSRRWRRGEYCPTHRLWTISMDGFSVWTPRMRLDSARGSTTCSTGALVRLQLLSPTRCGEYSPARRLWTRSMPGWRPMACSEMRLSAASRCPVAHSGDRPPLSALSPGLRDLSGEKPPLERLTLLSMSRG
mmetsp:Transcript_25937/g.81430  ORF Transcript_25937/g.81430 Transcript_25937/m.81430 type:complete len:206 (-) Transcript_25937:274-891(-)